MSFTTNLLLSEADRLLDRAERQLRSHREQIRRMESRSLDAKSVRQLALRAEREVKRLELYRSVLKSSNPAHAFMPEYLVARGLVDQSRKH